MRTACSVLNMNPFFTCVVDTKIWVLISAYFHLCVGVSFESIPRYWVANKKAHGVEPSYFCSSLVYLEIWR